MNKTWVWPATIIFILAVYTYIALPLIFTGPFNPDEGWYLHSAALLWNGQVPYRDFGFPQSPLILLFHGFFQHVFGPSWYLGRFINVLLGAISIGAAMEIARRFTNSFAAGVYAGIILAFSAWFAVQMVEVSTYALAGLLLLLLVYMYGRQQWFWVGFLSIAALWTRFSLLLVLPLSFLACLTIQRSTWQPFAKGSSAAFLSLVLPFIALAPRQAWLNIAGFHIYTRSSLIQPESQSSFFTYLRLEYWPVYGWFWLLALLGLLVVLWPRSPETKSLRPVILTIWLLAASTSLAHSLAQNATYDTPLLPLLALAGGIGLERGLRLLKLRPRLSAIALASSIFLLGCFSFFSAQMYYQGSGNNEASHQDIARTVNYIQSHSSPSDGILTPELYIPLQAKRSVTAGLEMGRFFYFPEFTRAQAYERGVLNQAMLEEAVTSRTAKFVIFNEAHYWNRLPYGATERDAFASLLVKAGYRLAPELHDFLPALQTLRVYERI